MSTSHSLHARQSWGRAADAFETVAWRAPSSARFNNRVAKDGPPETTLKDVMAAMPDWLVIVVGGVVAALTGAMLGGALAV